METTRSRRHTTKASWFDFFLLSPLILPVSTTIRYIHIFKRSPTRRLLYEVQRLALPTLNLLIDLVHFRQFLFGGRFLLSFLFQHPDITLQGYHLLVCPSAGWSGAKREAGTLMSRMAENPVTKCYEGFYWVCSRDELRPKYITARHTR